MKTCPFCAEAIQDAAIVCKHCGRDLPEHPAEQKKAKRARQAKQTSQVRRWLLAAVIVFAAIGLPMVWSNTTNPAPAPSSRPESPRTPCQDGQFGGSRFSCIPGPEGTVVQFEPTLAGDDATVMAAMRAVLANGFGVNLNNASTRSTGAAIRFIASGVYDVMPVNDGGRLAGLVVTRPD